MIDSHFDYKFFRQIDFYSIFENPYEKNILHRFIFERFGFFTN